MKIGALRIECQIPGARSLKDKRRPLKSLMSLIKNRFPCSVSEVDYQDLYQRSAIGVAVVAGEGSELHQTLQAIRNFTEKNQGVLVLNISQEIYDGPEKSIQSLFTKEMEE